MVIAAGSYPAGRWFESDRRYQEWLHGQVVKTSPFHGGNPSSNLGGVTKKDFSQQRCFPQNIAKKDLPNGRNYDIFLPLKQKPYGDLAQLGLRVKKTIRCIVFSKSPRELCSKRGRALGSTKRYFKQDD